VQERVALQANGFPGALVGKAAAGAAPAMVPVLGRVRVAMA